MNQAGYRPMTWRLHASEIWEEKASGVASPTSTLTQTEQRFSKSQQYDHFLAEARRWHSRRVPGVWTALTVVPERTADWIGNLNDPFE